MTECGVESSCVCDGCGPLEASSRDHEVLRWARAWTETQSRIPAEWRPAVALDVARRSGLSDAAHSFLMREQAGLERLELMPIGSSTSVFDGSVQSVPTESSFAAAFPNLGANTQVVDGPGDESRRLPLYETTWEWSSGIWPSCCVKCFEYPLAWQPMQPGTIGKRPPASSPTAVDVGIVFKALAQYWDLPWLGCECDCCEFRQYVRMSVVHVVNAGPGLVRPDLSAGPVLTGDETDVRSHATEGSAFREDCVFFYWDEAGNFHEGNFAKGEEPPNETFSPNGDPAPPIWECYGIPDALSGSGNDTDALRNGDNCSFWMSDYPHLWAAPGTWFVYKLEFLARILDRCHLLQVRAEKAFTVTMFGYVGLFGDIVFDTLSAVDSDGVAIDPVAEGEEVGDESDQAKREDFQSACGG